MVLSIKHKRLPDGYRLEIDRNITAITANRDTA
jgi:hypothetical protein